MNDPCLRYTLIDLRNMARGKIPGFSKMKKKELCAVLDKAKILPHGEIHPPQGFQGISPPGWDFDKKNPLPAFLLPYDYLYGAGSSNDEITRYFILPDNYPLVGIQLSNKAGTIPRREFIITVDDYLKHLDQEQANPDSPLLYRINGEEVNLDIVHIKGILRANSIINQIAPRIGSVSWFNLLLTLQITGMEGAPNRDSELRRGYQIITTPTIQDFILN